MYLAGDIASPDYESLTGCAHRVSAESSRQLFQLAMNNMQATPTTFCVSPERSQRQTCMQEAHE